MLPVVMLAVAAVGAVGKMDASRKAKNASFDQARLKERETMERARRLSREQTRDLGEAKAATYASNIQMTGSNRAYINDMQTEQARELSWMIEAGQKEASAIRRGAAVQKTAAGFEAAGSVVGAGAGAAGKWWGVK